MIRHAIGTPFSHVHTVGSRQLKRPQPCGLRHGKQPPPLDRPLLQHQQLQKHHHVQTWTRHMAKARHSASADLPATDSLTGSGPAAIAIGSTISSGSDDSSSSSSSGPTAVSTTSTSSGSGDGSGAAASNGSYGSIRNGYGHADSPLDAQQNSGNAVAQHHQQQQSECGAQSKEVTAPLPTTGASRDDAPSVWDLAARGAAVVGVVASLLIYGVLQVRAYAGLCMWLCVYLCA